MFKLNAKANIVAMRHGSASNLTIGRAFVRTYSIDGQPGKMSKEACVLPRNSIRLVLCACQGLWLCGY